MAAPLPELIRDAAEAEELFDLDELERYAAALRNAQPVAELPAQSFDLTAPEESQPRNGRLF